MGTRMHREMNYGQIRMGKTLFPTVPTRTAIKSKAEQ